MSRKGFPEVNAPFLKDGFSQSPDFNTAGRTSFNPQNGRTGPLIS
jgi:hypothetical protein